MGNECVRLHAGGVPAEGGPAATMGRGLSNKEQARSAKRPGAAAAEAEGWRPNRHAPLPLPRGPHLLRAHHKQHRVMQPGRAWASSCCSGVDMHVVARCHVDAPECTCTTSPTSVCLILLILSGLAPPAGPSKQVLGLKEHV